MKYNPSYPDMEIMSVYPSDNTKLDASNELINYALQTFAKYNFNLAEVKGCLNRISDRAVDAAIIQQEDCED